MSRNLWAAHYQTTWHERSGDPRLPYWLRVAALAYGSHKANGHALFNAGQIALVLATADPETGEIKPLDKGSVQRAIRSAVDYGWLAADSCSRCLIVPGHAITMHYGNANAPCPQHDGPRPKVGTQCPPKSLRVVS